jgi:hypothetical protein
LKTIPFRIERFFSSPSTSIKEAIPAVLVAFSVRKQLQDASFPDIFSSRWAEQNFLTGIWPESIFCSTCCSCSRPLSIWLSFSRQRFRIYFFFVSLLCWIISSDKVFYKHRSGLAAMAGMSRRLQNTTGPLYQQKVIWDVDGWDHV